jgi:hypothetical protein
MDEDVLSRPVRLSPTRVVFGTGGQPNPKLQGVDDQAVVISGVGTTNTITRIPVPGIGKSSTSLILPLSSTAFLISNGGADGLLDAGGDDMITLVTGIGGTVVVENVSAAVEFSSSGNSGAPQWLGRGRAVAVSEGANGSSGSGNDDVMRVVTDLPMTRGIQITKVNAVFKSSQPTGLESFSTSGKYAMDDPALLAGSDLTVSVGQASQTIPAARIKRSRTGVLSYADPKRLHGFITKLSLDAAKRKFSVTGKGVGIGIRTTAPAFVPVAIEADSIYFSEVVAARTLPSGFKFP